MALAARFRDLELFVVGIQQQLLRRQDRLAKAAPHMQTGESVYTTVCMHVRMCVCLCVCVCVCIKCTNVWYNHCLLSRRQSVLSVTLLQMAN